MGSNGAHDAIAVLALDPEAPCAVAIADAMPALFEKPSFLAFTRAMREARRRTNGNGTLIAAVIPSTSPELIPIAAGHGAQRIAVYHSASSRAPRLVEAAQRAAFAMVDLTIVPDEESENSAVRAGADPDRIVRAEDDAAERLVIEPPRKPRRRAAMEMAASLALDAAELSGFVRLVEWATPDRGVNVVNYHRILPLSEINSYCRPQMALAAPIFEAQLDEIARRRGFVRVDRVHERTSLDKVAITFDDGYEDNYRVALPILQRFSTPACIFVVTSLIGRRDALWWDRVGLALFVYWRDGCARPLPPELPERTKALTETRSFEAARAIISEVITELNERSHDDRFDAVRAAEQLVPKLAACRTMLSWDEVSEMAELGVVFGSHTRNHVPLDEVPPDVAREELFGSQRDLDEHLPVEQPRMLALPRGRLGDLTERELLAHGVEGVMTTDAGVNRTDDDSIFVHRRDGRMLTLHGRHHPAKLRLELTGLVDRLRAVLNGDALGDRDEHAGHE
jgi:peptidoglycan/xylan/chitin deacetylase (PgdA/CDA1 family)